MSEKIKERLYIVNPNLGHPLFVNIDPELNSRAFTIKILLISNVKDPDRIKSLLLNRVVLIPILEYKWKLKLLLEKKRQEKKLKKLLKEKKKKKGFWARLKSLFSRKKRKKKSSTKSQHLDKDLAHTADFYSALGVKSLEDKLKKLKPKAFRGDPIYATIEEVIPKSTNLISNVNYIEDEYCTPQLYLLRNEVFRKVHTFFQVKVKFRITEEVIDFLSHRNFVMFDIIHQMPDKSKRINSHSLVISKQDWTNFTFIHATDLHVAERNDRIYGIIKDWLRTIKKMSIDKIGEETKHIFKFFAKKSKIDLKEPLKKRLINPNNQFRRFIKLMNKKVLSNDIDFIALTGDLIDFTLLSKLPKDMRNLFDFDYEHSNWKIFKQIVLNQPHKHRRGVIEGEELLCPIFTIPGNHDYRPYHYDIRWAGMYRKIGLNLDEALALNDKLLAFPISAITKSKRALRAYWSEINPSLDFTIQFGDNLFIFLNSGSDSWRNFRDLVTGHPSLTGLSSRQIKYLENILNHKINKNTNVFLMLHGPPINPKKKRSIFKRIKKKFSKKVLTKLEEFKETILQKLDKKGIDARIDDKFNVKYGTVGTNWEKLIRFCKDYCVLTLAGHTHEFKEFRLDDPVAEKSKVFDAPPFSIKKVEIPAAVYFDNYSEMFTKAKDIEKYGPFVVQTPALGLGGYKNPELAGAYREIVVKDKKMNSFKVYFINK